MNRRCVGMEHIKVVRERRNVHKTGQENVRQFEQESIIPDLDDSRAKDLRIARIELALKELELLHLHRIDLGFSGHAFRESKYVRQWRPTAPCLAFLRQDRSAS